MVRLGCRPEANRLNRRAGELDSLDDAISNASALLTMSEGWREAWRNEQGPVLEDLASFKELCSSVQSKGVLNIAQESIWLKASSDRVAAMTNEMEAGTLTPSAALDELDTISQDVRTRAESLARRALKADTSSYRSSRLRRYESSRSRGWNRGDAYLGWWTVGGEQFSYDPTSTIRINPSSPGASASGVLHWTGAGSSSHFSTPISDLVTGYSSAADWQPSSSSGSSGYSGGGGRLFRWRGLLRRRLEFAFLSDCFFGRAGGRRTPPYLAHVRPARQAEVDEGDEVDFFERNRRCHRRSR